MRSIIRAGSAFAGYGSSAGGSVRSRLSEKQSAFAQDGYGSLCAFL